MILTPPPPITVEGKAVRDHLGLGIVTGEASWMAAASDTAIEL